MDKEKKIQLIKKLIEEIEENEKHLELNEENENDKKLKIINSLDENTNLNRKNTNNNHNNYQNDVDQNENFSINKKRSKIKEKKYTKQRKQNKTFGLHSLIATGFFTGYSPIAPGTIGSLMAYPFFHLALYFSHNTQLSFLTNYGTTPKISVILYMMITILILIGIWSIDLYHKTSRYYDSPSIVIDEIIGQLLTIALSFNNCLILTKYLKHYLNLNPEIIVFFISFFFFRFFDISKIFGIHIVERMMQNNFGVILDDIIAAIYAAITIHGAVYLVNYL